MLRNALAGLLAVSTLVLGACPARADIDLTGRWTFQLTSSFGTLTECQDVTQAGMVNDDTSACFEAVYDTADVISNGAGQFKAKQ